MGPDGRLRAPFQLHPRFQTHSADLSLAEISTIRVILRRGTQVALDTIVPLPATAGDTIALDLRVPVTGDQEQFSALLRFMSPQGDTLFAGGPVTVTAVVSGSPPPGDGQITVSYAGPGAATARAIRFERRDTAGFFGDTIALPAVVTDQQGTPIPNVLVDYASLDTTRAVEITPRRFLLRTRRGPVRIVARTFTGLADTSTLQVQPLPVATRRPAGDAQAAAVNTLLPTPLTVRVLGADSLGVRGVRVRFTRAAAGGALSDTSVFTDSTGTAATRWTLPTVSGATTVSASFPSVPALSPVVFSATAQPGPATALALVTPPAASTTAGVAQSVAVQVNDAFGNRAAFADTLRVVLDSLPPGATLSGPVRVVAANGAATFPGLVLTRAFAGYRLRFEAPAAGGATVRSLPFAIVPAAPQVVAITTPAPPTVTAGTPFTVAAEARDTFANVTPAYTGTFTVALGVNPGVATLGGTTSRPAVAGAVTFSGLTLDRPGTGTTLVVTGSSLPTAATSAGFVVQPGAPAAVAFTAGPSSALPAGPLPTVTVEVRDALGNRVTSFADTVALALDTVPVAGAQLTGPVKVVAVGGVATFAGVAIARAAAGYRLRATATGVAGGGVATAPFTVTPAAASVVALVRGAAPANALVGAPVDTLEAEVRDAFGNVIASFADTLRVVIDSTTAVNPQLQGTVARVPVNGRAVFGGLTVRPAGAWRLAVTAPGIARAATALFTMTAPTPTTLAAASATSITAPVFTQLGDTVAVRITGTGGLPVAGVPVQWADGSTGTIVRLDSLTNAQGIARVRYRLPTTAGAVSLVASAPTALPSQTVTFTVTGVPLAARRVVFAPAPPTSVTQGVGFPVTVSVRDTFNNAISTFPDSVRVSLAVNPGSAVLTGATALLVTAPAAATTLAINQPAAGYRLAVTAPGLLPDTSPLITVAPVGGGPPTARLWTGTVNNDWGNPGNWSPIGTPNPADTVLITAVPNSPIVTVRDTVEVLLVASGSLLVQSDTLFVNARAVSRGITVGPITMLGTNTVTAGNFGSLRYLGTGIHNVTDTLLVSGPVTTFGGLAFSATGPKVVNGDFRTAGPSGTLGLLLDTLVVQGHAVFDGALMNLAGGTMLLSGDLLQSSSASNAASFAPAGSFTTVFVGPSNQTVHFAHPATTSRLAQVVVAKPTGLLLLQGGTGNALQIAGDVALQSGDVQAASTGLEVTLGGSLVGIGTLWRVDIGSATVRLASLGGFRSLAPGARAALWSIPAGFTWTLGAGTHGITGDLEVEGFLDLASSSLELANDLVVRGNNATMLVAAGAVLTVNGTARFEGSVMSPAVGTFRFRGGLSQVATNNGASYRPSGTHETIFDGAATQVVTFQSPGTLGTESRFQRLRIANGATVTFASTIVADSIDVGTASVNFLGDTVAVRSLAYSGGATDANWPMDGKVTRSTGGGPLSLPSVLRGRYVVPAGAGSSIRTNTTIRGAVHVLGAMGTGDGTTVVMDSLLLLGDTTAAYTGGAVFSGGGSTATLTVGALRIRTGGNQTWDGTLRVRGDIRVDTIGSVPLSERGGNFGNYTLELIGTGPQSVRVARAAGFGGSVNGTSFQRMIVQNTSAPVTLTNNTTFFDLVMEPGASLAFGPGVDTVAIRDTFELRGTDAVQYPAGSHVTRLEGGIRLLPDTIAGNVHQQGTLTLPLGRSVLVTGNWVSSAVLTLNFQRLRVQGSFTSNASGGGSALIMNRASDTLEVVGPFRFASTATGTSTLTRGTLILRDSVAITSPAGFAADSGHQTVFAGTAAQAIRLDNASSFANSNRFNRVRIENPNGVVFASTNPSRVAMFTDSVFVNGPITTASVGDTVELRWTPTRGQALRVPAATPSWWGMAGRATRVVAASPFVGNHDVELPDSLPGSLVVDAVVTLSTVRVRRGPLVGDSLARLVVRENLQLNARLEATTGDTITVLGDLRTSGAGSIAQTAASSVVRVLGNASFDGAMSNPNFGRFELGGNLSATGTGRSFAPGTGHTTVLNGSAPQTVSFATPNSTTGQRFGALTVNNAAGVTLLSSTVHEGVFSIQAGTLSYGAGHAFTEVRASLSVSGGSLGTWAAPRVLRYAGTANLVGPAVLNGNVEFATTAQRSVQAGQVINGDLTLSTTTVGANVLSSNGTFTVNGNLTIANEGALRLQAGSNDTIEVAGNLTIAGTAPLALASLGTDALSASVLILRGNVTQTPASTSGFGISKAYRTRFLGTAQQLSLQRPATFVNRRFGRVEVGNGSAPTVLTITDSSFWASGALRVRANATVQGGVAGRRIIASDSVEIEPGGVVNLGATGGGTLAHTVTGTGVLGSATDTLFVINGALTVDTLELGGFIAHRLEATGTGTVTRTHLKVAEGYPNTPHRLPPGSISIPGTLRLGPGSRLATGGAGDTTVLTVSRIVSSGGAFVMNDGADSVHVLDSLVTTGAGVDTSFQWTAGRVALMGPVNLQAPRSWNSAPLATHRTWFAGAGRQTITLPATGLAAGMLPGILHFVAQPNRSSADSIVGILRASRINISGTGTPFVFDDATRRMEVQGALIAPASALLDFTNSAGLNEPGFTYVALGAPPGDTTMVRDASATFSPDTLILRATATGVLGRFEGRAPVGSIPNSGSPYNLRTVIAEGTSSAFIGFASGLVTIANDLSIASFNLVADDGDSLSIGGTLRTAGTGYLTQGLGSRITTTHADFRGGAPFSTPTLEDGTLFISGNFTQAVNPLAFRTGDSHRTIFTGLNNQRVTVAHPDTSASAFHDVDFLFAASPSPVLTVASNVTARNTMRLLASTPADSGTVASDGGTFLLSGGDVRFQGNGLDGNVPIVLNRVAVEGRRVSNDVSTIATTVRFRGNYSGFAGPLFNWMGQTSFTLSVFSSIDFEQVTGTLASTPLVRCEGVGGALSVTALVFGPNTQSAIPEGVHPRTPPDLPDPRMDARAGCTWTIPIPF